MDHAEATAPGGDVAFPGRSGRQLSERERRLEEREHQVTEREREADEREREADEREREADQREREADQREARQRQHAVELRARAKSARERASQAVEEAKTVLDSNQDRVRRAEAARLARTEEHAARIHDELAARDPGNPEHERLAGEAREAMRRARETERKYTSRPELLPVDYARAGR